MSFQLRFTGQPLDAEIRRMAGRQLERIGETLSGGGTDEGIHDARKRLKKLRGLLRLVRLADDEFFRGENARYRDLARTLSGMRDLAAQIEALDALPSEGRPPKVSTAVAEVRRVLVVRRDAGHETSKGEVVAAALASLGEARRRIDGFVLPVKEKKAVKLVADGFAKVVSQGRRDVARAGEAGAAEDFHDLRKRVKYHGMHLRLLGALHPPLFDAARKEADDLAEDLGLAHDYDVLRATLAAEPRAFGAAAEMVSALAEGRQGELQARSLLRARRLFAEEPEAASRRIRALLRLALHERNGEAPEIEDADD